MSNVFFPIIHHFPLKKENHNLIFRPVVTSYRSNTAAWSVAKNFDFNLNRMFSCRDAVGATRPPFLVAPIVAASCL